MPVAYEVTPDNKAIYNKKTLKEWLGAAVDDLVAALDPVQIFLFGSLARDEDGPHSDLDLLVVFDQIRDDEIMPLMSAAHRCVTAPVPCDVLVTDLARHQFNRQRLWHIEHQIANAGVLVYEREPRIPKELYMNPERPDNVKDAEEFMERARKDLVAVRRLYDDQLGMLFHAQQAAEKAIKALLIIEGIEPAWTHSLVDLAECLPERYMDLFDTDGLESLTPWAVAGRYPRDLPDISNREPNSMLDVANDTVSTVERLIDDVRGQREKSVSIDPGDLGFEIEM
jgi:HEPN domain-containing protein